MPEGMMKSGRKKSEEGELKEEEEEEEKEKEKDWGLEEMKYWKKINR